MSDPSLVCVKLCSLKFKSMCVLFAIAYLLHITIIFWNHIECLCLAHLNILTLIFSYM